MEEKAKRLARVPGAGSLHTTFSHYEMNLKRRAPVHNPISVCASSRPSSPYTDLHTHKVYTDHCAAARSARGTAPRARGARWVYEARRGERHARHINRRPDIERGKHDEENLINA